ncbi:MAG TPA: MauE/DoxX family redox-associated membrane protein [Steroidobacteraceae bacterium]|nr:MauE/DoxX family redox-associated membrane protein [Steroidobacteraceae bacterium]
MRFSVDPVFSLLAIAALALLFGSAALAKLRDRARFTAVLEAYDVLPAPMARILAVGLPFMELAVAIGLFVTQFRPVAAGTAGALLLIYGAGIAWNLARGRRDIDCGCEGFGQRRPIAPWMLVRNAILIGVAAVAGAVPTARPVVLTDVLTIAGGLAVFVLIYFAADRLLAPRALA